ncbi:MAG TPA: hypothetical protein VIH57_16665, partial [Bacteroidales bacterium]
MRYLLPIFLLFIVYQLNGQELSKSDSLLQRKYYHKIYPRAVNSKHNLLYAGIDNTLEIQYPDELSKTLKLFLKTHNGILFESGNGYITIPRNAGRAFISVYLLTETQDTLLIDKKEFTVVNIPIPSLKIGSIVIMDQSVINRSVFFKNDSLKVYFTDDLESSI